jgi:SAM-dependent methyltransferase
MTPRPVPRIFDRRRAAAKWARARSRQQRAGACYLTETLAGDVTERLDFMRVAPARALVVGDASGRLPAHLAASECAGSIGLLGEFDEEQPGPLAAFDLIVHLLGLGMVNDLPGALIHARVALTPGGLFVAAFPGAGSLPALRQITLAADRDRPAPRIHPQVDNRAGTALLERAGFARQVVDSYPVRVRFPSLRRMLSDLRDHGLTASLSTPAPPLDRAWLTRADAAFDGLREEDGKVTETFEILVLTGWR